MARPEARSKRSTVQLQFKMMKNQRPPQGLVVSPLSDSRWCHHHWTFFSVETYGSEKPPVPCVSVSKVVQSTSQGALNHFGHTCQGGMVCHIVCFTRKISQWCATLLGWRGAIWIKTPNWNIDLLPFSEYLVATGSRLHRTAFSHFAQRDHSTKTPINSTHPFCNNLVTAQTHPHNCTQQDYGGLRYYGEGHGVRTLVDIKRRYCDVIVTFSPLCTCNSVCQECVQYCVPELCAMQMAEVVFGAPTASQCWC